MEICKNLPFLSIVVNFLIYFFTELKKIILQAVIVGYCHAAQKYTFYAFS